jgi:hypothetical protein
VDEKEAEQLREEFMSNFSILIEVCASDDLIGFKRAIEDESFDIDEAICN